MANLIESKMSMTNGSKFGKGKERMFNKSQRIANRYERKMEGPSTPEKRKKVTDITMRKLAKINEKRGPMSPSAADIYTQEMSRRIEQMTPKTMMP